MWGQAIAGKVQDVVDNVTLFELLSIAHNNFFLVLIQGPHRRLEETGSEAWHIQNSAVNEELLDDMLVGENFAEPEWETDVVLERLTDDTDEEWNLRTNTCSESHSKRERDDVL